MPSDCMSSGRSWPLPEPSPGCASPTVSSWSPPPPDPSVAVPSIRRRCEPPSSFLQLGRAWFRSFFPAGVAENYRPAGAMSATVRWSDPFLIPRLGVPHERVKTDTHWPPHRSRPAPGPLLRPEDHRAHWSTPQTRRPGHDPARSDVFVSSRSYGRSCCEVRLLRTRAGQATVSFGGLGVRGGFGLAGSGAAGAGALRA